VSDSIEPHPLDQDWDDEKPAAKVRLRTNAYMPLLKLSIWTAIGSAIVILIATLGLLIASPNSIFERGCGLVHTIGRWILLIACCGIFVAYRIPKTQIDLKLNASRWIWNGFTSLIFLNMVGVLLVTAGVVLVTTTSGTLVMWIPILVAFFSGMLATIAVWHRGFVRAYAIGTLTSLFFVASTGASVFLLMLVSSRGRPSLDFSFLVTVIFVGLPPVTGIICAGYVIILENSRRRRVHVASDLSRPSAEDETW
jgi:hypothetical protein